MAHSMGYGTMRERARAHTSAGGDVSEWWTSEASPTAAQFWTSRIVEVDGDRPGVEVRVDDGVIEIWEHERGEPS